jgi:hypothetical protein
VSSSSAFRPYVSVFSLYPYFISSPHPAHLATPTILSSSPKTQTFLEQVQRLDFGPLRQFSTGSIADSQRHLCAYEFSDGTCRDPGCPDIHRRDVDPSGVSCLLNPHLPTEISEDTDIAHYFAHLLPNFSQEQVVTALAKARTQKPPTINGMESDPLKQRLADAVQYMMENSTREPPG